MREIDQKEKIKEENNKKAAEFARRLADREFKDCDVTIDYCLLSKIREEARKMSENGEAYKKAELISQEIIDFCISKGLTILEFRMLRTVLPSAIERKIDDFTKNQILTQVIGGGERSGRTENKDQ